MIRARRLALRLLRRFLADGTAAMAPAIAGLGVVVVGTTGMALDVGLHYVADRELRSATEAAALAAAMDPLHAQSRAETYLSRNGYDPSVLKTIEVGRYCADSELGAQQRFIPNATSCPHQSMASNGQWDAVRIRTGKPSQRYLSAVLGGAAVIPDLSAIATAARIDEAGIGITSGVITVTNSLVTSVNGLLGSLLGISLNLDSSQIEALMRGDVDAGLFFDDLAQRAGFSGTYSELVQGSYGMRDIALAAADATSDPGTKAALTAFGNAVSNSYQVPLSNLFGLGVWEDMPVGEASARPTLRAGVNAYQLLTFAVQAGNFNLDLSDAVNVAVPGSTVRLTALASSPGTRPRFSFGPAGETAVGTNALRLQLEIGLGQINLLGGLANVDSVPLLIDIAPAYAQTTSISCNGTADQAQDTLVAVDGTSGLVNAFIGRAPDNAMDSPMPTLTAGDIEYQHLVSLLGGVISVGTRATAGPILGNTKTVYFGPGQEGSIGSPEAPGTPAHIGNGSQVGPLIATLTTSLAGANGLKIEVLGACVPLLGCDTSLLRSQLLPAIVAPVSGLVGTTADPLLDNLLAALGIQLGHATVWATGARCGVPVLV